MKQGTSTGTTVGTIGLMVFSGPNPGGVTRLIATLNARSDVDLVDWHAGDPTGVSTITLQILAPLDLRSLLGSLDEVASVAWPEKPFAEGDAYPIIPVHTR